MFDVEAYIFDKVEREVKTAMPDVTVLPGLEQQPPKFPCLAFYEADNRTYQDSQLGDGTDHHISVMYTAEAFSVSAQSGKYQCKRILSIVDDVMRRMGFQRTANVGIDNYDRTVSRRVARYTGVVGEDGIVYRQ